MTDSVVTVAVLGGICYFLGAYAMSQARKGAYLPKDLSPDDTSQELVATGAMMLVFTVVALSLFALLVVTLHSQLRPLLRRWRPWTNWLQNLLGRGLVRAGRSERSLWNDVRRRVRAYPIVLFILLACFAATLIFPFISWLTASIREHGKPYPRANVQLARETLSDLRYVRRTDGFFLFLAEDKKSYLLIPDSDVRRVQLFPVVNAEE